MAVAPQQSVANINGAFLFASKRRVYTMPSVTVNTGSAGLGQRIIQQLNQIPGWLSRITVLYSIDVDVTAPTAGSFAVSTYAPENLFPTVEVALGGAPFQRTNARFYRDRYAMSRGSGRITSYGGSYTNSDVAAFVYTAPAVAAGDNTWKGSFDIVLQPSIHDVRGLIPLGTPGVRPTVTLTTASALVGSDPWVNPILQNGATGGSATIGTTNSSTVQLILEYLDIPSEVQYTPPVIGSVYNILEDSETITSVSSPTVIRHKNPYSYMRLNHYIVTAGAAVTAADLQTLELDLNPAYALRQYTGAGGIRAYLMDLRERFGGDLTSGLYPFDLISGSDPRNPNGTEMISGEAYPALQTQVVLASGTAITAPSYVRYIDEAFSPVTF